MTNTLKVVKTGIAWRNAHLHYRDCLAELESDKRALAKYGLRCTDAALAELEHNVNWTEARVLAAAEALDTASALHMMHLAELEG